MNNKTLLIIMLLALGTPWAAWGQQTLTVYENEAYNNCATIPVQSNRVDYGDLKCEYVIPAADIALMNETSIYAMDLYMYSPSYNGDWGNARFQVFMKEVEETEFDANQPSFYGTENATIVYTGSLNPTGLVMTIPFSNPYLYHGGNLLVGFYITQTGTPRNASFLAKSTNSYWGPTTYPAYQGCNGSYTRQSYLPKTTFAYSSEPVSFLRPRNLAVTDMTSHSVTMSWTNGGDETAWQLVYSDNAQFNPDDADPIAVSSKPYTLDGLDIGTTYYIYLRADYGDGNYSAWSDMIYIEPLCFVPSNLHADNVTNSSASLSWTAGNDETAWQLVYSSNPAFDPDEAEKIDLTQRNYSIQDLTAETTYYAYVRANCGDNHYSGWSQVCSFTPSNAIDLLAVDGTSANNYVPMWLSMVDYLPVRSQFIIPAENLQAMQYGQVKKLTFYHYVPNSYYEAWGGANFKVYLMETDNTVFESTTMVDWSQMTEVYDGLVNISGGKMEIVLPTAFDYENGNLLVGFNQTATGASAGGSWYGQTRATNTAVYGYSSSNTLVKFLPKTTISYFEGTAPTCSKPRNIAASNVTGYSATLSWTPGGDETAWQLVYSTNPDFDPDEVSPVSLTENPFSLGELESNTTYYAYLRSDCGEGETSPWSDIITFTTDCGYMALPYSHDFDSDATGTAAPTCWHFSSGGYRRIYESASMAHSGSNFLLMQKPSTESACYAVLPAVNTTEHSINTLKLTFWARMWNSSSYYNYLSIGVMTDPDDIDTYQLITSVDVRNAYSLHEIYFDDYAGEGQYIVLRCYNTSNYFCIDDIEVSVAPTCRQPLELSGNYTDVHEANIRWKTRDLHQCNYQVSYGTTEGFNPEEGTIVDAEFETDLVNAGTPYRYYDLTNLDANTTYYFYVRANCGEGDFSAWSDDYGQFTTMEACPVPSVYVYTEGSHSVTFSVMEYEYGDLELRYKKASDDEWSEWSEVVYSGTNETSNLFVLDNLEENTEYEVEIRANCGEEGYSTGAFPLSFTTLTGCGSTPRTWMCTTHLGTKATVEWFPENDATRWQIRYRIEGQEYAAENMVLTDEITSSPYRWMLTGLETSTVYYWQVRSYCDENTQSDWSEEAWFTTRCSDGFITVDKAHPFFEDFEGADMPDCWDPVNHYDYSMSHLDDWSHITGTNYSWETYNASKCISSDRNHFQFNSNGAAVLAPALHIDENATSATLSFWSKCDFESSDARGTMHIFVSDNINADDGCDFDLGTLWESFGRKSFWRKYVISLDDYIGKTINIRFEYGVTHNYNNFDWLIDDVKVEVFDNVFGEGSDITEGSWDDPSMWRTGNSKAGGGLPTINDNVLINAKVMIPEGFVAQVNKIELNIDTVQVDRSGINKYGSLVIADGGQLKVNNPVGATMQKAIAGYGRGGSNWFLIAPPVVEALKPESDSIGGIIEGTYDLYSFDGSQQGEEWRNYKQHEQTFKLKNGLGYLVANSVNTSASFTGTVLPSNRAKEVGLAYAETTFGAWNLVGNPYTCEAYLSGNRQFYRLEETAEGSRIVLAASNAIAPMEGIFVQASDGDDAVTFTTTAPTANANALNFSLRKVEQGRGSISTPIDRARIRFGEGDNLGKLTLMASPDRLYIPQNGTDYAVVFSQPVGELPLNFEATEDGTFTLSFENAMEGLVYCHLIDNLTGADVDLLTSAGFPLYKGGQGDSNAPRQGEYTFTAKKTDYASRFRVVFAAAGAGGDACEPSFAFNNNGNWIILNEGRATLQVIDLNGRILSSEQIEGSVQTSIHQPAGLYLIRLVNGDDVRVQKVVVR